MKIAFASTLLLAAAALAQGDEPSVPDQEASPAAAPAQMATPVAAPAVEVAGPGATEQLLVRLASFFDLSHVSNNLASMPVLIAKVYDPVTGKFNMLASGVSTSGGAYYVPVCPVDAIASAGMAPAAAQGAACSHGIQLTPLPTNVASATYRLMRTLFRAILSTNRPSFMATEGAPPAPQPAAQAAQPAPGSA
ncbi:hypothetical protein H4R21_005304 [Coemansia helicoidea]|uniref:Uncharacterized protein n=1 Tax=Coemansia helicoidea TaxID=1286919 RepID=A0ACC1KUP3_9FUNG|nr:hypothetical protein H4R21_005304 [Coemansia helicoidea]